MRSGAIAEGTRWETGYTIIDSGDPGPCVLITAGIHGNEPAGCRAAEQVRHWPVGRGHVVLLPRCNVPGLRAGKRHLPGVTGKLRNLNRNFPGTGTNGIPLGEPATAIWT